MKHLKCRWLEIWFFRDDYLALNKDVISNEYGLELTLGGGIEYKLSKRTALQMTLNYDKGISSLYNDADFKLKALTLGIGMMKRL